MNIGIGKKGMDINFTTPEVENKNLGWGISISEKNMIGINISYSQNINNSVVTDFISLEGNIHAIAIAVGLAICGIDSSAISWNSNLGYAM